MLAIRDAIKSLLYFDGYFYHQNLIPMKKNLISRLLPIKKNAFFVFGFQAYQQMTRNYILGGVLGFFGSNNVLYPGR